MTGNPVSMMSWPEGAGESARSPTAGFLAEGEAVTRDLPWRAGVAWRRPGGAQSACIHCTRRHPGGCVHATTMDWATSIWETRWHAPTANRGKGG